MNRFLVSLFLLTTILIGCGSSKHTYLASGSEMGIDERPSKVSFAESNPWIIWTAGIDHEGKPISDRAILEGDEAVEDGKFKDALKYYKNVKRVGLIRGVDESLAQRIAGTLLAVGDAKQALSSLSDYYRKRVGGETEQVPVESSLLLGFAYSQMRNNEQAIAWLSQADHIALPTSTVHFRARAELEKIIAGIPQAEFETFATRWKGDDLVNPLISHERYRRSQGGPSTSLQIRPFNSPPLDSQSPNATVPEGQQDSGFQSYSPAAPTALKIGALLPLSGPLSQLGISLQQGIMLASENPEMDQYVKSNIRDSGLDPAYTEQVMNEMYSFEPINAYLGPLMPENATFALQWAKQHQIPLITFVKTSDIQIGGPIFRFGTTPESQVESLLRAIGGRKTKVAIVYPNTPTGLELADLFERQSLQYQLEIVSKQSFEKGDGNALNNIADKIAKKDIEMIFFPDSTKAAAHFFAAIPEKARAHITPLGTATWDNLLELQNSGYALDGAVFPTFYSRFSGNPASASFFSDYQTRYAKEPDALAALGFDAVATVVEAAKLGTSRRMTLEESLYQINNYNGITGSISVSSQGEWKRILPVLKFQQNMLAPYTNVETSPIITAPSDVKEDKKESVPTKEKLPSGDFPF